VCATNIGKVDVACLETDNAIPMRDRGKLMKYYVSNIIC